MFNEILIKKQKTKHDVSTSMFMTLVQLIKVQT